MSATMTTNADVDWIYAALGATHALRTKRRCKCCGAPDQRRLCEYCGDELPARPEGIDEFKR